MARRLRRLAQGSAPGLSAFDAEVKRAVETFGARPEVKARIHDLAARFKSNGEHFVRNLAAGQFFETCSGEPSINPSVFEDFGGRQPLYDPVTGKRRGA